MSLGHDNATWCHPSGSLAADGWDCVVDDAIPGWAHTGLRTATLSGEDSLELELGDLEAIVLPLSGGVRVDVAAGTDEVASFALAGRPGVFAGATDVAYAPPGTTLRLRPPADLAPSGAVSVAVCLARRLRGHRHPGATPPGRGGARRAPRRRHRVAPGAQLRSAGGAGGPPDDRVRGHHAGRQLELVAAAQARRRPAWGRGRARGDLLVRDPVDRRHAAPTRSGTRGSTAPQSGRSTSSPRCAPATSCSCRTAGTAPPSPHRTPTSTTSTSWPGRAPSAPG